jgi:Cu2+-exporting ATPase
MFRRLFWVSLVLSVPVLVFSEMVQSWFGYSLPEFTGSDWVAPVLGTVVFVYGGRPFLRGAVSEVRSRRPGMMLLIGMAITVAFIASAASTVGWFDLEFWWELAALITIMLLGHWIEMRAVGRARSALDELTELLPDEAERLVGDHSETVSIADLRAGDTLLVRPGGRVPADGEVIGGEAQVDESMVTGESRPVPKTLGDAVVAGTVATDSSIRIRVTAVGEDTALAGIRRLVARAQESRSRAQALADRAAAWLFYVAAGAAVVTFVTWVALSRTDDALTRTVSVLVIACPHALGLAIPLVISISTAIAAKQGILVTDRIALEKMRSADIVVFDKTGTLTKGAHRVVEVAAVDGDPDRLLAMAAGAEAESEHPLAMAIVDAARQRGEPLPRASQSRAMAGRGVQAVVDGVAVAVGGPALIGDMSLDLPSSLSKTLSALEARGAATLFVIEDGVVTGAIGLEDEVRPESRAAVEQLQGLGMKVVMLTGDSRQVAQTVADELGIDEFRAEVLPENKHSEVARLQENGLVVAMVGDGVNDAPALAQADVGIAIGAGTDVAVESAGVVLASDDPRGVIAIWRLSKAGYRKMWQNLAWATGYNALAIPVAAGAFAWAGLVLPPAAAAILMSLSTIVVALNAQWLRRLDLRPGE